MRGAGGADDRGEGQPTSAPSDELLLYLFIDRVAGEYRWRDAFGGRMRGPMRAPLDGAVVGDKTTAAALLAAAALARLRERRTVELSVYEKRRLLRSPERRAAITLSGEPEAISPLTARILFRLEAAHTPTRDVRDVVPAGIAEDPTQEMIEALQDEAVALGLASVEDTRRMGGMMGSRSFDPDIDRIAKLEPAFRKALDRWQMLEGSEPELHELLLAECEAGLRELRNAYRRSRGPH